MKVIKSHGMAVVLFVFLLFGCTRQEEEKLSAEKPISEIFEGMEKLPDVMDPDPIITEPNYEEIFGEAYSFRVLEEISATGEISLYAKEILTAVSEQLKEVNPKVKEKFKTVTVDDLVRILDPRIPLDPQLEEVLIKILETEKLDFSEIAMPEMEGLDELKAAYEEKRNRARVEKFLLLQGGPQDNSCAQEVYIEYGSGARSCGSDYNLVLERIESNYLRRSFEAGERYEQRNEQVLEFGVAQLPIVVGKLRKVLILIKEVSTTEEVKEIRGNLGYLAAAYAYYLRINFPLWKDYGLRLNEWFYYKELELYAEVREIKEAEAYLIYSDCIDWVNGVITEEVNRRCPGDEPVLY